MSTDMEKLDIARRKVAGKLKANRNKQADTWEANQHLYRVNRELESRIICRKDYDSSIMQVTAWFFNKANDTLQYVNKLRRTMLDRKLRRLRYAEARIKREDVACFQRECKALQRRSPYSQYEYGT